MYGPVFNVATCSIEYRELRPGHEVIILLSLDGKDSACQYLNSYGILWI